VSFGGNIGTLKIDNPASFTGTINGLVAGDVIDLGGLTVTSAVSNGSILTVTTAGGQTFNYQVAGAGLAGNVFALENDQHGGTILALGKPAPVIFSPNSQTVFTGFPAVLGPISIADPGPGGSGILSLIISAVSGCARRTERHTGLECIRPLRGKHKSNAGTAEHDQRRHHGREWRYRRHHNGPRHK
jgi:hypothetical protein